MASPYRSPRVFQEEEWAAAAERGADWEILHGGPVPQGPAEMDLYKGQEVATRAASAEPCGGSK